MTLTADLALVERALNSLERREVRVLVWGLIDSALSAEEVEDSLEEVLRQSVSLLSAPSCTIATSGELRRRMLAEGLLFEVPRVQVTAPARFRTRMGEGIRLLARLRQLFPHRHDGRDGWIAAPTLVADYRLLWRPRRYPRRDISALQALDGISQNASATALEAVRHWLGKADPGWTLARFQIDATRRILEGLEAGTPRGTIVAAGTGSGKTLAFYLPALAWLAAQKRAHPGSGGVRVIALYPRNELLKDQLLEVFGQSRKFDDFLGRASATGISVGVLYGDTPETVGSATTDWQKSRGICPFFRCPKCKGEMRLAPGATKESDARLLCGCGAVVSSDVLRLTRK